MQVEYRVAYSIFILIMVGDIKRLDAATMSRLLEASLRLMTSHNLTIACDTTTSGHTDTRLASAHSLLVRTLVALVKFVRYSRHLILG